MIAITDTVLDEMVQAIVEVVDPEKIVLFGSRVDRIGRTESDIDLLIIERGPFTLERPRRQELLRVRRALARFRIAKDILLYSREEVDEWQDSSDHVLTHALRQGRCLYARP